MTRAFQQEILCLNALLESYAQSTGLRVNFAKSGMVPLNMDEEKAQTRNAFYLSRTTYGKPKTKS
jgi:hypothetical protein